MRFNIRELREEKKMSQTELSRKSKVSRTIISGLENGSTTTTSTETLRKIANALGSKISDIFLD